MSEKLVSQRQELRGVGVSSGIGFGHARVMQTSSVFLHGERMLKTAPAILPRVVESLCPVR